MATRTETAIVLPRLDVQMIEMTLIGDTPLITHQWSEKSRKEMRDKQTKRATKGREAKDPHAEFEGAIYRLRDGRCGMPAIAFKNAAVTACTSLADVTKVAARQAFHVEGEMVAIDAPSPTMREDMVRVGMGTADLRYRPEFSPWRVTLLVKFNAGVLSAEQVLNLFNVAGFAVGVGEWRPERDGNFGRFHVASEGEL
jgi:hypothetical protein